MIDLKDISVKIANYKCFREAQGFEEIRPINVIIGRNNSGKSALLDLVQHATSPSSIDDLGHKGKAPQILLSCEMTEDLLKAFLREDFHDNKVGYYLQFARNRLKGRRIQCAMNEQGALSVHSVEPADGISEDHLKLVGGRVVQQLKNPFRGYQFRRIVSDRDIQPEKVAGSLDLQPNGGCATAIIERFINAERLPSHLVERDLLDELNSILRPDTSLTRILVQQREDQTWEINLEERTKGTVPMSHTGSGVKTVLLVLINLLVPPFLAKKPLSQFLFGFEELENNLHPAMQRRLFLYLRRKAIDDKCTFFLTTHSNVVIDLFSKDNEAQILHVRHDGECAKVTRAATYLEGRSVLNDLGVRASDLLQSNVVVWVEGPSDRVYFNSWINLWSEGMLLENVHYQCLPYGGSVIAHLSFDDPNSVEEVIQALKINSHAIVLMDSDKTKQDDPLKPNPERIAQEVKKMGGICWISAGKEIENYIPLSAFRMMYKKEDLDCPDQFEDIFQYVEKIQAGQDRYRANKVSFARKVCPHITREAIEQTLDMNEKLDQVCERIRAWNGIP